MTFTRRWLQWQRLGDDLPGTLIQIWQRELRPVGSGTATEEWVLVEFEEATEE